MKLTLSVALATYNGARYIAEQLESLSRQTVLPDELVVVDDHSDDGTLDIVAAFSSRAPFRVRFQRNEKRLGYRANFIKTAGLCTSDIIALCDQDDVWLPHKLEKCLNVLSGHKDVLLTYHNATVVGPDLLPLGTLDRHAAPNAINPPGSIGPWRYGLGFTQAFRRELLAFSDLWPLSIDFFNADEKEAQDQWFFFLASTLGTIGYIPENLVLYRRHDTNTSPWQASGPGLRGHLINLLATNIGGLRMRQLCALQRAIILDKMQKRLDDGLRERVAAAAGGYRKLEASYRLRRELYTPNSAIYKIAHLIKLIGKGCYRPSHLWGGGRKALIRDIIRGILLPRHDMEGIAPADVIPAGNESQGSGSYPATPGQNKQAG